jgi:hypothetical protein
MVAALFNFYKLYFCLANSVFLKQYSSSHNTDTFGTLCRYQATSKKNIIHRSIYDERK